MKKIQALALAAFVLAAIPGAADAALVRLVQAGNQMPSGGWCDANGQSLAANSSRSYQLQGRIDGAGYSSINGKIRMKTQTDKFEWAAGSEPAVTFTEYASSPNTFSIKAKAGAPAGTHTIDFVAVDANNGESEVKSCKITVTGGGTPPDLKITFTAPVTNADVPASQSVTFTLKLENIGQTAMPSGVTIALRRFDHTGTGMSTEIGSPQTVSALAGGGSNNISFTEATRPGPTGTASVTYLYKVLITPSSYTDVNPSNHLATRSVRYVAAQAGATFATLKETFQHARCTTCHGFSAASSTKPGHSTSGCTGCHSSAAVGVSNWHAPAASFDLRGKTDAQLCAMAKTAPAGKTVAQHLKNDELIKWAISDGRVPNGTTLQKAPPANLTTWNQRVDAWIAGGMLCQ